MGSMGMGGSGGQGPAGAAGMSKGAAGALKGGPGGGNGNMGRSNGPQGAYNPRYTRTPTRVYDASLENLAKLATRVAPGPGLISGAVMDITGMRPGFSGYQGMGNGYSYDGKDRNYAAARQDGGGGLSGLTIFGGEQPPPPTGLKPPKPVTPAQPAGLQFAPTMQPGRFINANAPGLASYGLMTSPYRVFR